MRIFKVFSFSLFLFIFLFLFGSFFSSSDTRGFERAIVARYDSGYESILASFRDASSISCGGDGLSIESVPFGSLIFWCDSVWFLGFDRLLIQLSGPSITEEDLSRNLSAPNDMDAQAILREMHRRFSEGQGAITYPLSDTHSDTRLVVARDFGEQIIYPEQISSDMLLGDIRYVIVQRKNANTPLDNLPSDASSDFAGVLAQYSGGPWQVLFELPESYIPTSSGPWQELDISYPVGSYMYFHANVHDFFFEQDDIYVDILDASGAGSGEGRLARLVFNNISVEQFISWELVGEMYFIPEIFSRSWSWRHMNDHGSPEKAFSDT